MEKARSEAEASAKASSESAEFARQSAVASEGATAAAEKIKEQEGALDTFINKASAASSEAEASA